MKEARPEKYTLVDSIYIKVREQEKLLSIVREARMVREASRVWEMVTILI